MNRLLVQINHSIWRMKQIPQFAIQQCRNYVIMDDDDEILPLRTRNSARREDRFTRRINKSSRFPAQNTKVADKTSENSWLDDIPLEPVNWNTPDLPEIKKNLYKSIATYSDTDIDDFRTRNEFKIYPSIQTTPIFQFDDIENLPEPIKNILKAGGYSKCTPIQAESIPVALSGENVTVSASFGSGKTLAYLIPALVHISNQEPLKEGEGPLALVLVPTRDQAIYVSELATKLGASANVRSIPLYGRVNRHIQLNELSKGREIVVATPGRLIDFLKVGEISLSRCGYVVLDEADALLSDSFQAVIHEIDTQIRPDRQLSLWTSDFEKLLDLLKESNISKPNDNPVDIILKSSENSMLNANIKQNVCACSDTDRYKIFRRILDGCLASTDCDQKTLVFTSTQVAADDLAGYLRSAGIKARSVKSSQELAICEQRKNIDVFLTANTQVHQTKLDDIKYVIIYEYPESKEELISRMNHASEVFTIITSADGNKKSELLDITGVTENEIQSEDI